ncbi:MAG: decarboxylating NADP(+)-dependent phosphogluconate dehydrogenase [Spirochaetia bacterium]|nr:decarboxylating NADP(+)-dependent phosphogluconate dehydrogenase [Spirochaetia bacterium]
MKASIGLIGLAVMGENLVLNLESKGYSVAVYNRTIEKVDNFINSRAKQKNIIPSYSIEELVSLVEKPRKIMMMVRAGEAVDKTIDALLPFLDDNDIIIDGGNSNYFDTIRRLEYVNSKGKLYIGAGVSGGEEGALLGPSIMPGGNIEAWEAVKPIFQKISAKVENNIPCCDWIGPSGSGHFVKMVHNGIEYGDMQLISEIYDIMRKVLKLSYTEMHNIFKTWNNGPLNSYLIEITSDILAYKDENNIPLVENILDAAGQKGTGKWTLINALDNQIDLSLIAESVFARIISSQKEDREFASKEFEPITAEIIEDKEKVIEDLHNALFAAKIISYAQGFDLIRKVSNENQWNLDLGNISLLWRGGCIIRSSFLSNISEAYKANSNLKNLILDPYFKDILKETNISLRRIVSLSVLNGVATPSLSAAISFFDSYRSNDLPANLIQAQRDYFGAHTYERKDKERGQFYHTNWTSRGGNTSSSTYSI